MAMEYYTRLVPHQYTPTIRFYENVLLPLITAQNANHYLPVIWTKLTLGRFDDGRKQVRLAFSIKVLRACVNAAEEDQAVRDSFVKICEDCLKDVQKDPMRGYFLNQNVYASEICDLVIQMALQEGRLELAKSSMKFCCEEDMPGLLPESTVESFVQAMVEAGQKEAGYKAVVYAAANGMERAESMGKTLGEAKNFQLEESEKYQLNSSFAHSMTWVALEC